MVMVVSLGKQWREEREKKGTSVSLVWGSFSYFFSKRPKRRSIPTEKPTAGMVFWEKGEREKGKERKMNKRKKNKEQQL